MRGRQTAFRIGNGSCVIYRRQRCERFEHTYLIATSLLVDGLEVERCRMTKLHLYKNREQTPRSSRFKDPSHLRDTDSYLTNPKAFINVYGPSCPRDEGISHRQSCRHAIDISAPWKWLTRTF